MRTADKDAAIDTETTGVFPYLGDRPFAISWCTNDAEEEGVLRRPVDPFTRSIDWEDGEFGNDPGWPQLFDFLSSRKTTKIFHNYLFDRLMLEMAGFPIEGPFHDTMAMIKVLFSSERMGLKYWGKKVCDIPDDDEKELEVATKEARKMAKKVGWRIADNSGRWGDTPWKADFWLAPPEILNRYAKLDARRTIYLKHVLWDEIHSDTRLQRKYYEEIEVIEATYQMSKKGIVCSKERCNFEVARNNLIIKTNTIRLAREAGDLNVNSPKQVAEFVYDKLGFPVTSYTVGGAPSVDAESLRKMDHPVIGTIIKIKAADKAINNFFERYKLLSRKENGLWILHPEFNPLGATTGRYSCRNPNLQNVANAYNTRSSEPIQARTPFRPRPGMVWFHWDWSQIEMWIFAAECEDEHLLHDLGTGNLHVQTANRLYGHGRDIVAEEMKTGRSNSKAKAKMFNFGVVFGMGVNSAAEFLKVDKNSAKRELDRYYNIYPRIRPFMQEMANRAEVDGFIWNRFGRRIQVERGYGYKATNYIVQSSAADHMKRKLLWLDKYLRANSYLGMTLILTIHDELVVEGPENPDTLAAVNLIKEELEDHGGIWSNIKKLPVECAITRTNWAEKEKLEI